MPYFLMAGPDFDPLNMSNQLQKDFSHVKNVIFRPPLNMGEKKTEIYYQIPSWVTNLYDINYLRLDHAAVEDLLFLQKTKIKHLVIHDIMTKDWGKLIDELCKAKQLKYLACDFEFSSQDIVKIKTCLPNVVILTDDEYYKKVDDGEIMLFE